MPCYQSNNAPSGYGKIGTGGYATEAECLQACKEGACCNGTTCSVKPQCQCDESQGFGFQGVGTSCSPNPCNVGACCVGPTCYQKSEEQCAVGFNIGSVFNPVIRQGVFVGDNVPCSPNPCCPTCEPYVADYTAVGGYRGRCCRTEYVDDGHGACCPPGRDCCGGTVFGRAAGADNGACCPESMPYCCRDPVDSRAQRCQAWPRAYDNPAANPPLGFLDACLDNGALTKTITLPESPFSLGFGVINRALTFYGGRTGYTAKFIIGDFEWSTTLPKFPDNGSAYNSPFCKPPGVTTMTLVVENLDSDFGVCSVEPFGLDPVSAYRLDVWGKSPCDCNPLP